MYGRRFYICVIILQMGLVLGYISERGIYLVGGNYIDAVIFNPEKKKNDSVRMIHRYIFTIIHDK